MKQSCLDWPGPVDPLALAERAPCLRIKPQPVTAEVNLDYPPRMTKNIVILASFLFAASACTSPDSGRATTATTSTEEEDPPAQETVAAASEDAAPERPEASKPPPPTKPKAPRYVFATADVKVSSDSDKRSWRTPLLGRSWCEGKGDDGIGESITIEFAKPTEIASVGLYAGMNKGAMTELDAKWNRPTTLSLSLDDGTPIIANVDPDNGDEGETSWELEPAQKVQKLRIAFASVKRGKKRNSCLRMLELSNSKNSWVYPLVAPESAIAEIPKALEAMKAAFASCDPKALDAVTVFPIRWAHSDEGYELPVEGTLASAKNLSQRCKSMDADNKEGILDLAFSEKFASHGASLVFNAYAEVELRWTKDGWKLAGVHLDLM